MGALLELQELFEIHAPVNAIVYDPSHLDRVGGSSIWVLLSTHRVTQHISSHPAWSTFQV